MSAISTLELMEITITFWDRIIDISKDGNNKQALLYAREACLVMSEMKGRKRSVASTVAFIKGMVDHMDSKHTTSSTTTDEPPPISSKRTTFSASFGKLSEEETRATTKLGNGRRCGLRMLTPTDDVKAQEVKDAEEAASKLNGTSIDKTKYDDATCNALRQLFTITSDPTCAFWQIFRLNKFDKDLATHAAGKLLDGLVPTTKGWMKLELYADQLQAFDREVAGSDLDNQKKQERAGLVELATRILCSRFATMASLRLHNATTQDDLVDMFEEALTVEEFDEWSLIVLTSVSRFFAHFHIRLNDTFGEDGLKNLASLIAQQINAAQKHDAHVQVLTDILKHFFQPFELDGFAEPGLPKQLPALLSKKLIQEWKDDNADFKFFKNPIVQNVMRQA